MVVVGTAHDYFCVVILRYGSLLRRVVRTLILLRCDEKPLYA
eukprot:COSAG01_NODE_16908_length_1194_cov_13.663014_2_plen_41_part_01